MKQPWFWWLLTLACLAWYATVTVYVAIRGARDIRVMLARLAQAHGDESSSRGRGPTSGSRG